jgi:thiosulfate dehydrogenase [quinone] large subunit
MIMYYLPRLDFPMVGENNFIVEYHLVYAVVLVYLAAVHAGQVIGLDQWAGKLPQVQAFFQRHPRLGAALS